MKEKASPEIITLKEEEALVKKSSCVNKIDRIKETVVENMNKY